MSVSNICFILLKGRSTSLHRLTTLQYYRCMASESLKYLLLCDFNLAWHQAGSCVHVCVHMCVFVYVCMCMCVCLWRIHSTFRKALKLAGYRGEITMETYTIHAWYHMQNFCIPTCGHWHWYLLQDSCPMNIIFIITISFLISYGEVLLSPKNECGAQVSQVLWLYCTLHWPFSLWSSPTNKIACTELHNCVCILIVVYMHAHKYNIMLTLMCMFIVLLFPPPPPLSPSLSPLTHPPWPLSLSLPLSPPLPLTPLSSHMHTLELLGGLQS